MHRWSMEIPRIDPMNFEHSLMVCCITFVDEFLHVVQMNVGQLKTTSNSLPPQTTRGKEGSSCRDAQVGRSCFLCGRMTIFIE